MPDIQLLSRAWLIDFIFFGSNQPINEQFA